MAGLHENIPRQNEELFYAAKAKRIGIWTVRRGLPECNDGIARVTEGVRLKD